MSIIVPKELGAILTEIKAVGGQLWLTEDNKLRYTPQKAFTPDLLTRMKAHKSEIIHLLREHVPQQKKSVHVSFLPSTKVAGYSVINSQDKAKLMQLKERILQAGICSLDYESNSDPDQTQDPQDTEVVGASVAYRIGEAFYLPMGHTTYEHNWDRTWLFTNFLKPILENPDVLILAHNMIVEHMWSILNGVDMYPKTKTHKVLDTMMMVKACALPETVDDIGKVRMGLKPATKALLADCNGMVHGLLHIDQIKSFKETVGRVAEVVPDPSGAVYKTNSKFGKKGDPKMIRRVRTRRFDELPIDSETVAYACSDADWALGLYYKLKPICDQEKLTKLVFFNTKRMMLLGEYQLAGWQADPTKIERLRAEAEQNLYGSSGLEQQLHDALIQLAKEKGLALVDGKVFVPSGRYFMGKHRGKDTFLEIKYEREFSWNSVPHRQWLFFHVLGIDTKSLKRSKKTGLPQVDAKNMDKITQRYAKEAGDKGQFLQLLAQKHSYDKVLSTYVKGMGDFIRRHDTNKIHTNFRLVDTWRLASSKPNLQNCPRAENDPLGIRSVFVAPTYNPQAEYSHLNPCTRPVNIISKENLSGETMWITCDYSQLELRIMAWYSREQAMIDAFHKGEDLHSATAKLVFNLDCPISEVKSKYKPYRYRAKAVNFGLVYGITEHGLSEDPKMGLDIDGAKQLMADYFATYPKIKEYMDNQVAFARKYGYVQTMFGHRRPIVGLNDPNPYTQRRAENKAINTPVQGSGADIIALAMVNLRDEIPTKAPYLKPVMQIHDELILECPVEYVIEGQQFVKEVMERPIKGFSEVVPLVADPAVGKRWDHTLDIKQDAKGTWYVEAEQTKTEPSDVTFKEIEYALPLYEQAGIEVRVK